MIPVMHNGSLIELTYDQIKKIAESDNQRVKCKLRGTYGIS